MITIWLVEDESMHRKQALSALKKEFNADEARILVNSDIVWPADRSLPELRPDPGTRQPLSPEHLPDIVILDLHSANSKPEDQFAGSGFYNRLREEEQGCSRRGKAHVIVYSQYRGEPWTEAFVDEHRGPGKHFTGIEMKLTSVLIPVVRECWYKVVDGD